MRIDNPRSEEQDKRPGSMPKTFRRGRLSLCPMAAVRIVDSIQSMVGQDTVIDTCCDKGRRRAGRPLAHLG